MSDNETTINTKWFRSRLAERKLSQRGVAKLLGMDAGAVSLMLRGRRAMRMKDASELARLFGVPLAEVLVNAGVASLSSGVKIAITGWLDPHGEVHYEPDLGEVDRPHGLSIETTAVQARTAGSEIDYMDGWLLFIDKPSEPPSPEHLGRLCLVRMTNGVVYLAQVRRGYAAGRWNLAGPVAHANDVALDWSAPVLSIHT